MVSWYIPGPSNDQLPTYINKKSYFDFLNSLFKKKYLQIFIKQIYWYMYFIQTPFESIQKIGIGDKLYVSGCFECFWFKRTPKCYPFWMIRCFVWCLLHAIYKYTRISIYKFGLSVCLYPINVETAEPIGPTFSAGHHMSQRKVYRWS